MGGAAEAFSIQGGQPYQSICELSVNLLRFLSVILIFGREKWDIQHGDLEGSDVRFNHASRPADLIGINPGQSATAPESAFGSTVKGRISTARKARSDGCLKGACA